MCVCVVLFDGDKVTAYCFTVEKTCWCFVVKTKTRLLNAVTSRKKVQTIKEPLLPPNYHTLETRPLTTNFLAVVLLQYSKYAAAIASNLHSLLRVGNKR